MIDRKSFFDAVRQPLFNGSLTQRQVDGMEAIFVEWEARQLTDLGHLAYMLTTAHHETDAAMYPVEEYGLGRGKAYAPYYGRGLVQLTWKRNYQLFGKRIGVDLVNRPDLALRLDYSITIMMEGMLFGLYTGRSLSDYDFNTYEGVFNARAIINGDKNYASKDKRFATRGAMIADYFQHFRAALQHVEEPPVAEPVAGDPVVFTEPDFSNHPQAAIPEEGTAEYREFIAAKRAKERAAEYRETNSKPLWQSTVTKYVLGGITSYLAIKFGITIPPEYQDIAEGVIVAIMGAGAVYGRAKATSIISGVFKNV